MTEQRPSPHSPEAQPELDPWTPDQISKFLFHSFRHSQGSRELHYLLFDYARSVCGAFVLPSEWESAIKDDLTANIRSYLQATDSYYTAAPHHDRVPAAQIAREVNLAFAIFRGTLADANWVMPHENIIAEISTGVLVRDTKYLRAAPGRPRREASAHQPVNQSDPFFSYLLYFAVEGHPTGLALFDRLYQEIGTYLQRSDDLQAQRFQMNFLLLNAEVMRISDLQVGRREEE